MKGSFQLVDAAWASMDPNSPLFEAIRELSPEGQRAINLRFWENYTIEEIAGELRMSWENTDLLLEESINRLREHLAQIVKLSEISKAV